MCVKRLIQANPLVRCIAVLVVLGVSGCGAGPRRAGAVDPEGARAALTAALDRWKAEDPPTALRDAGPPIIVQDMDWERGCRLVEYRILDDGTTDDANLRVGVKLVIHEPGGSQVEKNVRYIVGTDPKITVFREWF